MADPPHSLAALQYVGEPVCRMRKPMDITEWVAIVVAFMSAIATCMAACTALKMLKLERFREKNRTLLLKHASEIEHLQGLIASFARVVAWDSEERREGRNQQIDKAIQDMQFHLAVLEALNTTISADITQWVKARNPEGQTIPQVVYYQIGQLHPIGHSDRVSFGNFVKSKMEELKGIQDKMYSEMREE